MVDRARPHVGPETSAGEAMRLALREGALPKATCVREELATYSATHVGRDEGCATLDHASLHVIDAFLQAAQPYPRSRPARAA